jgi:hypothetical protein
MKSRRIVRHHPSFRCPCSPARVGRAHRFSSLGPGSCKGDQPATYSLCPRPRLAREGGQGSRVRRRLSLSLFAGDECRVDDTLSRLPRVPTASHGRSDAGKGHRHQADGRNRASAQRETHLCVATTRHPPSGGGPVRGLAAADRRLPGSHPDRQTGGLGVRRVWASRSDEPTAEAGKRRASACTLRLTSPTVG